jgi:hypothetical protein
MNISHTAPAPTFAQRLLFAVPIIGWVARDLLFGDKNNVWAALIAFVSLWMCSALTFGLPGLYLPALALVPVIFLVLILITKG